jgi:hypothetical protein
VDQSTTDQLRLADVQRLLVICRHINSELRLLEMQHKLTIGPAVQPEVIRELETLATQLADPSA